jgi:hypothetical protein
VISGGARFSCVLRSIVMIIECTFAETRSERVFHLTINATPRRRDSNPRITSHHIDISNHKSSKPILSPKCFSNASDPPTSSPRPPPPPPPTAPPQYKPSTNTANPPESHPPSIRLANLSPSTATRLHISTSAPANGTAIIAPKPPLCMVRLLLLQILLPAM